LAPGGRRCRQVGAGAVLRLVAASNGRAHAVECRVLWRAVRAFGRVSAAASRPDLVAVDSLVRDPGRVGTRHGGAGCDDRTGTKRYQERAGVRLADAGRTDRG